MAGWITIPYLLKINLKLMKITNCIPIIGLGITSLLFLIWFIATLIYFSIIIKVLLISLLILFISWCSIKVEKIINQ